MFVATWNVRSLLESEGLVETACQISEVQLAEDRKIDLVITELEWFGGAAYKVKDSVVLATGRPVPQKGEPRQRGEGVAIVLLSSAVSLRRADGEQWKGWSSRIVAKGVHICI